MKTGKYYFECTDCGAEYSKDEVEYLCPECAKSNTPDKPPAGVLKTLYNYAEIEKSHSTEELSDLRYEPLLPIESTKNLSPLQVGNTPLCRIASQQILPHSKVPFTVLLKDDSRNPTFSLKDRASDIVCASAIEKNYKTLVAASTGNAGSSLAGISASMGLKSVVFVSKSAPVAKLTQISMYGARLITVDGNYDDAFELSIKATMKFGWYNRNTAFNPLTIEGKKTVAFELFEQLGKKTPDRIFVPVGDGCIISAVFKGFEDLLKLRLIDEVPTIVAVQSKGSDNLLRNLNKKQFDSIPASTIADSIAVDVPRNFRMTEKYMNTYSSEQISVTDEDIEDAARTLAKTTGIFAEPAAAAAFAGLLVYQRNVLIPVHSNNVVLITGSGLKDLDAVSGCKPLPEPIKSIDEIKKK